MKVYIAAPYELIDEARGMMRLLESRGHVVTSRWLKDDEDLLDESKQGGYAAKSLLDVLEADLFLLINQEAYRRSGTGGRHVELGYAIMLVKEIVILGVRSNVFHHLSCVRVIERVEDL